MRTWSARISVGASKAGGAGGSHVIVLVDTITAYAESADEHSIFIETGAAGKKDNSTFIHVWWARLKSLCAGILQILEKQVVEGAAGGARDARWKKGLCTKADGAIRDGGAERDLIEIESGTRSTVEVDHVACFGGRDIDAKDGGIGHATKTDDGAIEIGNGNDHPSARTEWQANGCARGICGRFRIIKNLFYIGGGETTQGPSGRSHKVSFGRLACAGDGRER